MDLRKFWYLPIYYIQSIFWKKRPLLGGVKLSHTCNLTCIHCPFWKKGGTSLSYQQAVNAFGKLYKSGVRFVILEGGEPFLWQDGDHSLNDLVTKAKELFFCVGITTNGTFPIETDADIVWVSIDGLKDTHDRIRGESFDKVIEHIESSSHPNIYAHVTINRLNWKEMPGLIEYVSENVKGITIQFHYPYKEGEEDLCLGDEDRISVLDTLIQMKKKGYPIADSYACLKALKDNSWTCRPWMIASIDPDGTVTQGCYVQNRGEIACHKCGFAAHTEISLAYAWRLGAVLCGTRIFRKRKLVNHK